MEVGYERDYEMWKIQDVVRILKYTEIQLSDYQSNWSSTIPYIYFFHLSLLDKNVEALS